MSEELQATADALFEAAREQSGARDPREYYRDRLRELKGTDPAAYAKAVLYYNEELIPSIASGGADPVQAWIAYGRRIAQLTVEGRTVAIDETGLAIDYSASVGTDLLILQLPEGGRGRAIPVGLPPRLSGAQQAAYDLLVSGRQTLRDRG